MSVPKYDQLLRPILEISKDGNPRHWKEYRDGIIKIFNMSEEDQQELVPSGQKTKLYDRTHWAVTYLVQAMCLERVKSGVTKITKRGVHLLNASHGPLTPSDLMVFDEFVQFQKKTKKPKSNDETGQVEPSAEQTPEEAISKAYQELKSALAQDLLDRIKAMSPTFFENLIIQLMLKLGYGGAGEESGIALGKVGDEGVDGVIKQDKLGLENIYLQAKRYTKGSVGKPEVQAFVGALSGQGATKGVFLTTSTFTKEAKDYANNNKSFKLSLIDGQTLADLMIDYDLGVSLMQRYEIKRIDSDFFHDDQAYEL